MKGYRPERSFDESVLELAGEAERGDEAAAAAFLAERAGEGPALELGVGSGRIALPLAARGLRVDGVDLSEAMVARLRAKPGGDALDVTMGDFADVPVEGRYPLVYVVFNSIFNLLTQEDQIRCFRNVAAHLTEEGVFVVEAHVPSFLHRLDDAQYVRAEAVGLDVVWLDVARYDPATQRLEESHVRLGRDGVRLAPVVTRYAWPSELDLMARLAGLRLRERWDGWEREPYTATGNVVSVYGR